MDEILIMEKIDFFQATKEISLNRNELAKKITDVPLDIAREYIKFLEESKTHLERTIALFHSMEGPFFSELLDQFEETELNSLDRVAETLNDANLLNKIDELLSVSMGRESPSDNDEKPNELIKLEKTLKNFGTQVASDILALTDEIAYFTGLAEDKRPEQREANYLLLGNFVSNIPPSRTKYANEFYDYLREAEQHKRGSKLIREKGLEESIEELDYQNIPLGKFQREISKLFKYMRFIEDDSAMSPKEKKAELDSTQRKINDLYKQAVEMVRENKNSK